MVAEVHGDIINILVTVYNLHSIALRSKHIFLYYILQYLTPNGSSETQNLLLLQHKFESVNFATTT